MLSNGYKFDFTNELTLKPCCLYLGPGLDIPLDHIDHAAIQTWREDLNEKNSHWDPGCSGCRFLTDQKLRKTYRDFSFEFVPDDAETGDASYLELQLDKICNGGCITCGPYHSSFWQQELKQYTPNIRKNPQDVISKILEIIDIQKTRRILFLGGEPLLTNSDQRVLDAIQDPSVVDLQYTTNGSMWPQQRRIDSWSRFRSVMINFSIDGIGNRFDYVRYPLRWDQVSSNVVRMIREMPSNVRFKFNHTITSLTLYYYDEFQHWSSQLFSRGPDGQQIQVLHTFNPADGLLTPRWVPAKLYEMLQDKYPQDHNVIKVVQESDVAATDVRRYLDGIDQRRGLSWSTVFPEVAHCFQ